MRLLDPYLPYFGTTPPAPLPSPAKHARLAKLLTTALYDIARLCPGGEAAAALATACADLPSEMHGWGLWYRHIFSRLVRNGRSAYPGIDACLDECNAIFGEDTDPELTAHDSAQAATRQVPPSPELRAAPDAGR
jgi:hypothetical protein